jgi:indole-3-glycerol phosphate synthase
MSTILHEIVISKQREVMTLHQRYSRKELQAQAHQGPPVRDFLAALANQGGIHLIAEIKRASPSARVICTDFDPVATASAYQAHGASCLSVLTDGEYFQGSLEHLRQVRAAVTIPILRKDFLIDDYQVFEARAAGADAVLLIAEILDDAMLARLLALARDLGMAALVEFHDPVNLPRVIASGAELIGINNRNLRDFSTDIEHTLCLRKQIPPHLLLVSESGISSRNDVERLKAAGISAILVGESLMRAADTGLGVDQLLGKV